MSTSWGQESLISAPSALWVHQLRQIELQKKISDQDKGDRKLYDKLKVLMDKLPKEELEDHDDRLARKEQHARLYLAAQIRAKLFERRGEQDEDRVANAKEISELAKDSFSELGYLYERAIASDAQAPAYSSYLKVKLEQLKAHKLPVREYISEQEILAEYDRLENDLQEVEKAIEQGWYQPPGSNIIYLDFRQLRDLKISLLEQRDWQLELRSLLEDADRQSIASEQAKLQFALKHWREYDVDPDPRRRTEQVQRRVDDLREQIRGLQGYSEGLLALQEKASTSDTEALGRELEELRKKYAKDQELNSALGDVALEYGQLAGSDLQDQLMAQIAGELEVCRARKLILINRLALKLQEKPSAGGAQAASLVARFMSGVRKLVEPIVNGSAHHERQPRQHPWRKEDWASVLIEDSEQIDKTRGVLAELAKSFRSDFVMAVDRLEDMRVELEQQAHIVEVHRGFLQGQFSNPRRAQQVDAERAMAMRQEIADLTEVMRSLRNQINQAKRHRQALFIHGLTDAVGARVSEGRELEAEIRVLRDLGNAQVRAELDEGAPELANVVDVQAAIGKRQRRIESLQREADRLAQSCRGQMSALTKIDDPKRSLLEGFSDELRAKVMQYLSLGYYNQSIPSVETLDLRLRFAELGYTFEEGIQQFGDVSDESIVTFLRGQLEDFFRFADSHPTVAVQLLSDLALTCAQLGGEDVRSMLLRGVKARLQARAALGQLGREIEAPADLSVADFKWKALADAMRWAPKAAGLPSVVAEAAKGYKKAGILGMLVGAGRRFVQAEVKAELAQDVLGSVRHEFLPLLQAAIRVSKGADFDAIRKEASKLAVLQLAGDTRRAIKDPKNAGEAVKRSISIQWRCFRMAPVAEKAARVAAQVLLPLSLTFAAAAAALTAGAVGVLMGASAMAVLLTQVLPAVSSGLNSVPGFSHTAQRVRQAEVEELLADATRQARIEEEADRILEERELGADQGDQVAPEDAADRIEALCQWDVSQLSGREIAAGFEARCEGLLITQKRYLATQWLRAELIRSVHDSVRRQVMSWQSIAAFECFELRLEEQQRAVEAAKREHQQKVLDGVDREAQSLVNAKL